MSTGVSELAQRLGIERFDDLEVTAFDLWPDGPKPAVKPPTLETVRDVWASVSDHDTDLHVLVVSGPGTSFSWSWAVCTVRGRQARWLLATPAVPLDRLLAALDDDERALLATWGSVEIDAALDPPDDDPIDTRATEAQRTLG